MLAVAILLLYATFFAAVAHNDHLALWGVFTGAVHGMLGGVIAGPGRTWIRACLTLSQRLESSTGCGRRDVVTFGGTGSSSAVAAPRARARHQRLPVRAASSSGRAVRQRWTRRVCKERRPAQGVGSSCSRRGSRRPDRRTSDPTTALMSEPAKMPTLAWSVSDAAS